MAVYFQNDDGEIVLLRPDLSPGEYVALVEEAKAELEQAAPDDDNEGGV